MAAETSQSYRITISRDDFSKLLTLLKVFENNCTDCDIQNGLFRCRTNDRQAVLSMNLNGILEENSLAFSLIKQKIMLLKTFELDDNVQVEDQNIVIESNESNYEINDPFSKMIFRKPIQKFIDNKFIDDSEFGTIIRCNEEDLIFSHDITNYMKRRISNISMGFQTDIILCKITDDKASLEIETSNHEDNSDLINDIVLNKEVGNKQFMMITLPFILDIASDMKLSVYQVAAGVYLCKFDQSFYGVPITVYTQVKVTDQ
jgi:hypothetical protein